MAQIGNVPGIVSVKEHLDRLVEKGLIKEWELPYENILTRLTAAIFFFTAANDSVLNEVWDELRMHDRLTYRVNEEKKLSHLDWRVEFNKDIQS